jgi:hypothetical protein
MKWSPEYLIKRTIIISRLKTTIKMRSAKTFWGRFGGGWNWKIGIQAGGKTVIVSLLVLSITFDWTKTEPSRG